MNSAANGTVSVIESLKSWASQPFSSQMNLTHWALFTGLIIVLAILWIMVLRDLKGAV